MTSYKIRPLHVGTFPTFEKSMFLLGVDPGTKIPAPCISWLIEGTNGGKVLVDTGPHAADAPSAPYHNKIERTYEHRIDRVLLDVGVDPEEIEMVIFTHLHWDHCYNLEYFKKATFYVQTSELAYAIDPIEWGYKSYDIKIAGSKPPWFEIHDRLQTVEGDVGLMPGILFAHLPGHSPGSAGVAVNTKQGVYLIAGDTIPLVENWEGNAKQKHIPSAILTDLISYYNSFKKIEKLTDRVLASHDFRSLDSKVWG
ncbi:N-acyl homoserine lactonase family protein [Paradesulfitobacterium aromaticivorans]